MLRPALRAGWLAAALLALAPPAAAQVTWNFTYPDVVNNTGTGFADPAVGQLRRDSVAAAATYLNTVLDGRGTVNITFDSAPGGAGYLASFGPNQFVNTAGSYQNGGVYQAARTNTRPFTGPDGDGNFNFAFGWNYVGQAPNPNNFDMVTVAIHELVHGVGFLSLTSSSGAGGFGNPPGTPGVYAAFDRHLQRGSGVGGTPQFNTNIASPGFGTFTGSSTIFTAGNNATTGLFFGGPYTREVLGTAAPVFAPNPYQPGSSTSHVSDGSAVMNPSVAPNVVKRLLGYEVAMLLDIGWNVYDWNNTTGNWLEGVNGATLDVNASRWRTTLGLVRVTGTTYNTFANPAPAPVLPPSAQVTSNIVLNFGGTGAAYTATNDIGTVRLARLNLNSTSPGAVTHTITGGTLLFGRNSDGTDSVLAPKIVQQNSGAFAINSTVQIASTANGLTVDGTGTGRVTIDGPVTGAGRLTKGGANFALVLTNTANDYAGGTTVAAGVLRLGASGVIPDAGTFRLSGGTLSTNPATGTSVGFSETVGAFQLTAGSAIALGTGDHVLTFTGITGTPTGGLTVTGWVGTLGQPGDDGRIVFTNLTGDPNATYSSFLSTVTFAGHSTLALFIPTGTPEVYELVPVPEPAAVLAVAAGVLGLGAAARRRLRRGHAAIAS